MSSWIDRAARMMIVTVVAPWVPACGSSPSGGDDGADARADVHPPQLVATTPANDDVDVARNVQVRMKFDEPIDRNRLDDVTVTMTTSSGAVDFWLGVEDGGTTLVLHPFVPFPEWTHVDVQIGPGLADRAGNAAGEAFTLGFATAVDLLVARPAQVSGPAGVGATVELLWGDPLDLLDPAEATWSSSDPSVVVAGDDGVLSLKSPGRATVTVTAHGVEIPVSVAVTARVARDFPPGRDPLFTQCARYDYTATGTFTDSGCDRYDATHWALTVANEPYKPPVDTDGAMVGPTVVGPYAAPAPAMVIAPSGGVTGGGCWLPNLGGAGAAQQIDLTGATTATLSFQVKFQSIAPDGETGEQRWRVDRKSVV